MRFYALVIAALLAHAAVAEHYCAVYQPVNDSFFVAPAMSSACGPNGMVVARGEYNASLLTVGWDILKVESNASFSNDMQARAVGFFESFLTADRAVTFLQNNYYPNSAAPMNPKTLTWLVQNYEWVNTQVMSHPPTDRFWHGVNLTLQQLGGMIEGFAASGSNISLPYILTLAAQGDLMDLDNVYPPLNEKSMKRKHWKHMNKGEFTEYLMSRSHCSAFIKVTPQMDKLFFAHATWQSFGFMMRIYKMITLNFNDNFTQARRVSFSSYPGALTSLDDYYVTDSGLTVIETSLSVFNFTLYDVLTPQSVLSWQRALVANRAAVDGSDWFELFSTHNSGTYNNQWMVVNRKRFTPNSDLQPGLLWITEQLPGYIVGRDMTSALQYGYWPSYNVPYFKEVFDAAGYPDAIKTQGPQMLDYQTCARAQMFREYQTMVDSIPTLQWLMQYNNYQYDPISQFNPSFSIAARGDLMTPAQGGPMFFGAIDCKVSDYRMAENGGEVLAYMGPTPQQPVFAWANWNGVNGLPPHVGLPPSFNFSFHLMK